MSGGSVEATLELWASSLRDVKGRIRPLFRQERMAVSAGLFLDAVLGPERRKTGWMRAEAAGDPGPWRQQALLGRARWDADALRDVVRDYVVETLAEPGAVPVIDETGFLKQGEASCGVARQYTGSAGKITNCQIGVFTAYASGKGHDLLDQAAAGAGHDRAGHRGRRALCLGGGGQHLRRGRDRDGAASGRQGLRARGQRHAPVQLVDRQA
jgi:SRSO17 transposase